MKRVAEGCRSLRQMIRTLRSIKGNATELTYRGLDFFGSLEPRVASVNEVTVLTYHRVLGDEYLENTYSATGIVVRKKTFETQLGLISRYFNAIGIEQFAEISAGREACPPRAVLVTFDDGWIDTYTTAFPALLAAGVPALVFIVSGLIGTQEIFWQEELSRYLDGLRGLDARRAREIRSEMGLHRLSGLPDEVRRTLIRERIDGLKRGSFEVVRASLKELRSMARPCNRYSEIDRLMNWTQVREMASAGISFGSHAVSHRILTQLSERELTEELLQSKARIEAEIGRPVTSIAYPNGDFDDQVIREAEKVGYRVGFATVAGTYAPGSDAYRIPRRNVHQNTAPGPFSFRAYVAGMR